MSRTKAQTSIEFIVLISFILLVFAVFAPFLWEQQNKILSERKTLTAEKIALTIKKEVDMAVMFGSGYERNFTIPENILGSDYTIDIHGKVLVLDWKSGETNEILITNRTSGIPSPGKNKISNEDDTIVFE